MLSAMGGPQLNELSATEGREWYESGRVPATEHVHHMRDLDVEGVKCRLYRPNDDSNLGLLVFFHGGGWVVGDLESHDSVCRSLCNKSGIAILAVDYRLAPEHKFPAAVEDAVMVTRWAHANAASLGCNPNRIAVGGDSAGGNLAAVVAQLQIAPLVFQLLIYPVTDARMATPSYEENKNGPVLTRDIMKWFFDHYIGGATDSKDPRVSPIMATDAVIASTPPALVITAEFDPLRDEGEQYAARLSANGVPTSLVRYYGMFHGFLSMADLLDDGRAAHAHAASMMSSVLNR